MRRHSLLAFSPSFVAASSTTSSCIFYPSSSIFRSIVTTNNESATTLDVASSLSKLSSAKNISLPRFGRRQKRLQQEMQQEAQKRKLQERREIEQSESAEFSDLTPAQRQQIEDDAWSEVSNKFGFATKPGFLSYRSFLNELKRFEFRWRLVTSDQNTGIVFGLELVRTNPSSTTEEGELRGRDNNTGSVLLHRITNTTESNAMSDMILWTKNSLESLQFVGADYAKKSSSCSLIAFQNPFASSSSSSSSSLDVLGNSNFHTSSSSSSGSRRKNMEMKRSIEEERDERISFLRLECEMHQETPTQLLFAPSPKGGEEEEGDKELPKRKQFERRQQLHRWAVVNLSKEEAASLSKQEELMLLSVSLQTWSYLTLSSLLTFLNRRDLGVANHELVTTLHSSKDLEPLWHTIRKLSGMHPSPWPIDPARLWYPGKTK